MTTLLLRGIALICPLIMCACGPKAAVVCEDFDKSVKGYNRMLRWHEVENAGMVYLDTDLRDGFMKSAEQLKKRGITITDYRILTSECRFDKSTGESLVEFDYYILPSNRVKTVTYHQNWNFDIIRNWKLKSSLPAIE